MSEGGGVRVPGVVGCGLGYGLRSRGSPLRSGLVSLVIVISWLGGAYVPSYPGFDVSFGKDDDGREE